MASAPLPSTGLPPFEYVSVGTVEEAVAALERDPAGTRLLAGGTDLLIAMRLGQHRPRRVVGLRRIPGLDRIRAGGGECRIGAVTSIQTLLTSDAIARHVEALRDAAADFASSQIRRMATVGGNLCWSSPSADCVPPLMVFDAELEIASASGRRRLPLERFFTGPGRNRLEGGVLVGVRFRLPEGRVGSAFQKLARASSDIAKVSCAARITVSDGRCDDVRIALGAVADRPIRARRAEEVLRGAAIDDATVAAAARRVREEISPISDERSTQGWRAQVSEVLARRMIHEAIGRANRGGRDGSA